MAGRLLVILGSIFAICFGSFVPEAKSNGLPIKYADKEFLVKQKFIFEILRNLHQPITSEEYLPFTERWIADTSKYVNYTDVEEFIESLNPGMLQKGETFVVYNFWYLEQTQQLHRFFDAAIDWDTYYKNVVWARANINEGMFLCALTLSVLHRKDLQGIVLPPIYEIYPHHFVDADVFQDANNRLATDPNYGFHGNKEQNVAHANATHVSGQENLSYFTEDVGLNAYYYYFMMDYAQFLDGDRYGLNKDRRAELYVFMYQQLLARYYLERNANGLDPIQPLTWDPPLRTGYRTSLQNWNGVPFKSRSNDFEYYSNELDDVKLHEWLIKESIKQGYIDDQSDEGITLRQPEAVEVMGYLLSEIAENEHSLHFYKRMETTARVVLSKATYHDSQPELKASVLMHYETSMRDPAFYQFYERLLGFYWKFKHFLPPYTAAELSFEGVEITSVSVEKLVTYFEPFDVDISNGLAFKTGSERSTWNFNVYARKERLNHKPFGYVLNINSTRTGTAIVRMYMGPKLNETTQLQDMRKFFVEMDQYMVDLVVGDNQIKRNTRDFYYNRRDRTTYSEMYQRIMKAYRGEVPYVLDSSEVHCGWPDRLLLPKGQPGGYAMSFFFIITPHYPPKVEQFSTFDSTYQCGTGSGSKYIDSLQFGFPFDREINFDNFARKNIHFTDVLVYHEAGDQ